MTNIIRVMQNIGFTTLPDSNTITPKNLGEIIEKMDYELQTICS